MKRKQSSKGVDDDDDDKGGGCMALQIAIYPSLQTSDCSDMSLKQILFQNISTSISEYPKIYISLLVQWGTWKTTYKSLLCVLTCVYMKQHFCLSQPLLLCPFVLFFSHSKCKYFLFFFAHAQNIADSWILVGGEISDMELIHFWTMYPIFQNFL